MRTLMDSIFRRYGISVEVKSTSQSTVVNGFFRSVNSDAWRNAQRTVSPLGEVPRGRYICLLPADVAVAADDILTVGGKDYILRRVEPTAAFADVVCQWCLCVERGCAEDGD